ncbi:MAG: hypothetical protein V3569_05275 [Acholeplasmataceae bacterium]
MLLNIFIIMFLFGCQEESLITVMIPQGSPELASIYVKNDASYQVDVILGVDPLIAAFSSQSHDVIIAPTNLGAKLYQNESSYIMLATIVDGNYFLASQHHVLTSLNDLEGKELIVFAKNQTPDIMIQHLLTSYDITCQMTYVDNIASANAMLILDPNLIIMTAEPSLSLLHQTYPNLHVLDLMPFYEYIEGTTYPQASIFVNTKLNSKTLRKIESDFKYSTNRVNEMIDEAAEVAVSNGIIMDTELIKQSIPRTHIIYRNAWENKQMIEKFLSLIEKMNPALIGDQLPNESFYYRGD